MGVKHVCVFCGSRTGDGPAYVEAARQLGQLLAARHLRLVFGGGHVGLMGVLADTVLQAGGEVVGVIPRALVDRELAHGGLTELHIVATMHERKARMADLSDGFLALPGGFGTADELFEILTWAQLGLHARPVGLLNVAGFFTPLLAWLDDVVATGFLRPRHRQLLLDAEEPGQLLDRMLVWQPPRLPQEIAEKDR
jgi:uncharacterized protein (TIGR00730 family)